MSYYQRYLAPPQSCQPAENGHVPGFSFTPPSRKPSTGTLPALLALTLGFAIGLALYAAFDASTRTGVHLASAAAPSQ